MNWQINKGNNDLMRNYIKTIKSICNFSAKSFKLTFVIVFKRFQLVQIKRAEKF